MKAVEQDKKVRMLLPFDIRRTEAVEAAINSLATQGDLEERGAVFTKPEVVKGILDLCDYVVSSDLVSKRILEPSAGDGQFLIVATMRLLESCRTFYGAPSQHIDELRACIRAVEIHQPTFEATRSKIIDILTVEGLTHQQATSLAQDWLIQDDFLLATIDGTFDVAVGNPPYVRQERIPKALLKEYKRTFTTLYDRADLYVLFYERCLNLLKNQGVLGFICANRWMKNKYGGPLREKISTSYNLDIYIDLSNADAFQEQVAAYPAVTIIRHSAPSSTHVLTHRHNEGVPVDRLFDAIRIASESQNHTVSVSLVRHLGCGRDPWLVDTPEILTTIRHLEHKFPNLQEAKVKVGIGVATGADKVYIGTYDSLPVEEERRLPLLMPSDLHPTGIKWSGKGLVNPWLEDGSLARLDDFPMFAGYLRAHEAILKKRHTAKKNPGRWYKTIDRVYPTLLPRHVSS